MRAIVTAIVSFKQKTVCIINVWGRAEILPKHIRKLSSVYGFVVISMYQWRYVNFVPFEENLSNLYIGLGGAWNFPLFISRRCVNSSSF